MYVVLLGGTMKMSLAKRPASPTVSVDKNARHDDDDADPLDDYHRKNVAEWGTDVLHGRDGCPKLID